MGDFTGITRVSQESLFSGLNNFVSYTVLQPQYGQYFGFTEEEVLKLIKDSQQVLPIDVIKEWYNKYQVGECILYNPWSIINCLKNKGELRPYWLNTASNGLISLLLGKANVAAKEQLEELLQGKELDWLWMRIWCFQKLRSRRMRYGVYCFMRGILRFWEGSCGGGGLCLGLRYRIRR